MPDRIRTNANRRETRRGFLKKTAAVFAGQSILSGGGFASAAGPGVTILVDGGDPVLQRKAVRWAIDQLQASLRSRGIASQIAGTAGEVSSKGNRILVARPSSDMARPVMVKARLTMPDSAEAVGLARTRDGGRDDLLVCGSDERGLIYAVLELADRVDHSLDPAGALANVEAIAQRPANPIRSITRLFTSEPEDKPWFYDKTFWTPYLTMLARERFNRFSLALGLGYNSPRNVPDSYFYFPYPFLLTVPGYDVTARGLSNEERDRNFAMLQWIGEEVKGRGLHFQLAIWTHAYQFIDSPDVNYPIDGLTPQTHAAYCKEALHTLLTRVPTIDGVTFRAHSESGIPQNSYSFWQAVFDGVKKSGRRVEIDIHAKGIEHKLLDMAVATGLPVYVSPKCWAEHMGLGYHQASIRELERARPSGPDRSIESMRRFTRYGYADYLREDRRYGVLWRMWPGTQRLLLWGDPAMAAAYSRYSGFCGSNGMELCEPLSFKGRMGSGAPGGRETYSDPSLRPAHGDWEKHQYSYRVWGRLLYDPDTNPQVWGRFLRSGFGGASKDCEEALAHASRVLPLVTVAHHPSASNNRYWPEIYTDMPIVSDKRHPYSDTPSPRRFGTVSSLDPVLFSSVDEFVNELIHEKRSGKYSPADVARWLDALALAAETHLDRANSQVSKRDSAAFRRLALDVKVQSGLGRFFAEKLRAATAYAIYEKTADGLALERALKHYRSARAAWKKIAGETERAYVKDLTFGRERWLRGHWSDRLSDIDADLADMEKAAQAKLAPAADGNGENATTRSAPKLLASLSADLTTRRPEAGHAAPRGFRPGEALPVELTIKPGQKVSAVRMYFRHVDQSEQYLAAEMSPNGGRYRAEIPGAYTNSPYPLLYFFELRDGDGNAWLYPGLDVNLSNQPYFVARAVVGDAARL